MFWLRNKKKQFFITDFYLRARKKRVNKEKKSGFNFDKSKNKLTKKQVKITNIAYKSWTFVIYTIRIRKEKKV